MFRFDVFKAYTVKEIKAGVKELLGGRYADLLPQDADARILIKPNLNSNMNALTGNTTDLRLVASVIEFLKEKGFRDITIGEGTNSGFYRNRISVISRLRIDSLAAYYGVKCKDLNFSSPSYIDFENNVKAGIAKECLDADFLINMPKLKTHFENGMSVCLKNMMGCLVGQENKKKTHDALAENILRINGIVKPHLHIVDAIFSMEGLGPTRGTPIRTGTVFIGTDPYLIDLMCAKFASFDYRKVRTLAAAEQNGLLNKEHFKFAESFRFDLLFDFKPPKAGPLASFIHSPKRQKYFLAVRNARLFNYICSTKAGGRLLYLTGLRQDVFIEDEAECEGLSLDTDRCNRCGRCSWYCPLGLELPDALPGHQNKEDACLYCLYCFCVCPEDAIRFRGRLGFMEEQMRQYGDLIRRIA